MYSPPRGGQWVVGYVGTAWPLGDGSTPVETSEYYEVRRLTVDEIDPATLDVLIADAQCVDAAADALDGTDGVGLIAVGRDETLRITSATVDRLDTHLVLDDDLTPLVDTLEDVVMERWQNLGMEPTAFVDNVFARAPTHLYVKDVAGRHVRSSEYYDGQGELLGRTDKEVYPEEGFGDETYADDMRVIETGEPIIEKEEFNAGDDNWSITSKVPITDATGTTVGLIGFTQVITKRKEYERALQRQNDRLEQFAEILSHDLRNPLSVANGHLKLAREADPDNEHLDSIAESIGRIDELVEDVLTLTRGGQRVVDVEPVSLRSVCRSCWEVVSTAEATVSVTDTTIRADPGRLRHVFENLFRNAVEHAGDQVAVQIGPLSDGSGFYVADDGPGISATDREQIFERGYTTSRDGTGLGLEIVRQIVDAHDWEISVTESESGGTRFEISGVEIVE